VYSKSELIRLYKKETNFKVQERLLLVIKVEHDNFIPAYAADELHRSRPWALYWLDRFSEEGVEGLKNRSKNGRPPDISEEIVYKIKNKLLSSKQGWMDFYVKVSTECIPLSKYHFCCVIFDTLSVSQYDTYSNNMYHLKLLLDPLKFCLIQFLFPFIVQLFVC
jgi:leucine-zipper of insertion element IS481